MDDNLILILGGIYIVGGMLAVIVYHEIKGKELKYPKKRKWWFTDGDE